MFCKNSPLDRAYWPLRRRVAAIWTHSDRDTRARGRAGSLSIGKFKCNGYRPELAETGLSGWRIAVEQRDGPRMSPINSAPKASPDAAFRDDCHVGLALTIANRQAPRKITAWLETPVWRGFRVTLSFPYKRQSSDFSALAWPLGS